MKKILFSFLMLAVVLAVADTVEMDRYTVVVTMTGSKTLGTEATAYLMDRARQALRAVALDRDITVDDYLAAHSKIARKFERVTLQYRRGAVRFTSDGGSAADYEFLLSGSLMELLVPETGEPRLLGRVACPCCGQEWPEGREVPEGLELVPFEDDDTPSYTGVLIDVRGLDFESALLPHVVTEAGDEVTGPAFADEGELADRGLVGYFDNRNDALMSDRVGSNPLVVRALSVTGRHRCDAVISEQDAALVHGSALNIQHLTECRVGFLVD